MKKTIKIIAIATFITCMLILSCAYAIPAHAEVEGFYTVPALVTAIDMEQDKVTCVLHDGNIFEFYGAEDWNIGDICDLYMWDCNSPEDITDDEVIDVTYIEHLTEDITAWID